MTALVMRDCSTCGGRRAFEVPECVDGHGPDCADLICVDCGAAIFLDIYFSHLVGSPRTLPRVAPAA